jgi:hypothetical protein
MDDKLNNKANEKPFYYDFIIYILSSLPDITTIHGLLIYSLILYAFSFTFIYFSLSKYKKEEEGQIQELDKNIIENRKKKSEEAQKLLENLYKN